MAQIRFNLNPDKITLKQYRDYYTAMTGIDKVVAATGISKEEAKHLQYQSIHEINEAFEVVCESATPVLPEMMRLKIPKRRSFFDLSKWHKCEVGFIPDVEEMTAAEVGDIMQLSATPEDALKNMVEIACILFRPIERRFFDGYTIQKYDSELSRTYKSFIEQMPFRYYIGGRAFFLSLRNELLSQIPEFSEKVERKVRKELKRAKRKQEINDIVRPLTPRSQDTDGSTTSKRKPSMKASRSKNW